MTALIGFLDFKYPFGQRFAGFYATDFRLYFLAFHVLVGLHLAPLGWAFFV